ncbi:methyltransferase domain-containing protein [Buchananella hordeovulneris]|uniref:methyltransferase domain-containing protein n=1 Tax=Buchananella hordeovulneris TaxID=52770 RepID=UPI0026DA8292|nr:methyltransferase domain-containing protein [Buchananella hordeovulneris]MDO5080382.1 methyltransferase domain-containing protein [Buchananella hordeovulneris]
METSSGQADWFADNQRNWDDRADLHMAGGYQGVEELVADRTAISAELAPDIHRFGDLTGKHVLHLQCHVGTDTIGFARRGAGRVVGLDLSPNSLVHARRLAARAAVDIEFVQANVYDARAAVTGDFDLVYTSLGVLCWLPDIARWAREVASLLRPGGLFFIRDDHPMFLAVGDDTSTGLQLVYPYFETPLPDSVDSPGSYVSAPDAPVIAHTRSHQWNHGLGEIITALIKAGLTITAVEEFTSAAWCRWPELMQQLPDGTWALTQAPERLPLQFAITARKQ